MRQGRRRKPRWPSQARTSSPVRPPPAIVKPLRAGGTAWLERAVSPPFLFAAGMALIPAFLLQKRIEVKAAQVVVFFALAALARASSGFRVLLTVLILLFSTVAFNLVTPFGRVLLAWGPLIVTEGALYSGLGKGLTLVGLMLLSRFSVRPSVVLPGKLGLYISTTLSYLNGMFEAGKPARGRRPLQRLDELFESVFRRERSQDSLPRRRSTLAGIMAVSLLVAVNWVLVFFPG